jgi:hypothetical protein
MSNCGISDSGPSPVEDGAQQSIRNRHFAIRNALGWEFGMDVPMEVLRKLVPQSEDHSNQELNGRRQSYPFGEDIIVRPLDSQQQEVVDVPHRPCGGEQRFIVLGKAALRPAVEFMRALTLKFHERPELIVVDRVHQSFLRIAEAAEIFLRDIDPALLRVALDIPKNVRQLQRDTEVFCVLLRSFVMVPEDLGANEADRRGDAVAVQAQLVKRLVPVLHQVHLHALEQVEEMMDRDIEFLDDAHEPVQDGVSGVAMECTLQFVGPENQAPVFLLDVRLLVHDIVGIAAKRVDGLNRLPFRRREKENRQQEIALARCCKFRQDDINSVCRHGRLPYKRRNEQRGFVEHG